MEVIEPITNYAEWRDFFFAVIEEKHPAAAGASLNNRGEYENVSFQVSADYKPSGNEHEILVTITITKGMWKGRHQTLKRNWKSDEPGQVALEAITAYSELKAIQP